MVCWSGVDLVESDALGRKREVCCRLPSQPPQS